MGRDMSITTAQAAERLGVSAHEVRRLIATGELSALPLGRLLLVEEESLLRRAQQVVRRGRPLASRTAWAALFEISGERAEWLDRSSRSRLRFWLRRTDPETIAAACRNRADRRLLRVLPIYQQELLASSGVLHGGITADVGADILARSDDVQEIYCSSERLQTLESEYGLISTSSPNLIVRVPTFEWSIVARQQMPVGVVAVDLLESTDVRTRRAGRELLVTALSENM